MTMTWTEKIPGGSRNHGQVQAERSALAFAKAGYKVFIQTPQTKDFNQDLVTFRKMIAHGQVFPEKAEADGMEQV